MKLTFNLLDSDAKISQNILLALQSQIDVSLKDISKKIVGNIKSSVTKALKSEPEYFSLKSGKLRYEMGIEDTSSVDLVIEKLVDTLSFINNGTKITRSYLKSNFVLTMMKSDDLGGVIYDESAFVNDTTRGYQLPWLQWLLLKGNQTIVENYSVKIGSNPNSRTGNAIMVASNKSWRVPTEFTGTQENNWTTRAISAAEDDIITILQTALRASL